ncbi:hypothetical protein H2248_012645 [Termitomyces sp. 'cryptogamus']|nr:hypothetical protein H2248_012645 [Termitomyces sp. 'cryptogamus']
MKATSPAQCSTFASLFAQGYSLHQIGAKTGLGKSTIGRIGRELEVDKAIVQQISTGRVSPQTVWNVLKEEGYWSATKRKVLMLKARHWQLQLKWAQEHQNWTVEDWKIVSWTDETKINRIGSDGKQYVWKLQGEGISDQTTTLTVKHGGGNNLMV